MDEHRRNSAKSLDGIIVLLGAPNEPDGTLSSIAIERCEQALVEHSDNPDFSILPTGGFGEHFNISPHPHGYFTTRYLINRGISSTQILPVAESKYTEQDATHSRVILRDYSFAEIVLVTSDFHMKRASYFFTREFPHVPIRTSASTTLLPAAELDRLTAHEKTALAKSIAMGR